MIEIFDNQSLVKFMCSNAFPSTFCLFVKNRFDELNSALKEAGEEEVLDLREHGYLIILEESDNLENLEKAGLNPEDKGILGTTPEAVTRLIFSNCRYYWISIAYTNSYMMEFFLPDCKWSRNYPELHWYMHRWNCEDKLIRHRQAPRSKVA